MYWVTPATNPAPSATAGPLLPASASTPVNAAYAETFERKSDAMLKIVLNHPPLVRLPTPRPSPTAAAAAPIGPSVTDRPRLTEMEGDHANEAAVPGRDRTAYTARMNVAIDPTVKVAQSEDQRTVRTATTTAIVATEAT